MIEVGLQSGKWGRLGLFISIAQGGVNQNRDSEEHYSAY